MGYLMQIWWGRERVVLRSDDEYEMWGWVGVERYQGWEFLCQTFFRFLEAIFQVPFPTKEVWHSRISMELRLLLEVIRNTKQQGASSKLLLHVYKEWWINKPYPYSLLHSGKLMAFGIWALWSFSPAAKVGKGGFLRVRYEFCGGKRSKIWRMTSVCFLGLFNKREILGLLIGWSIQFNPW